MPRSRASSYPDSSGVLSMRCHARSLEGRKAMEIVTGIVGGLSVAVALYLLYVLLRGGDER